MGGFVTQHIRHNTKIEIIVTKKPSFCYKSMNHTISPQARLAEEKEEGAPHADVRQQFLDL